MYLGSGQGCSSLDRQAQRNQIVPVMIYPHVITMAMLFWAGNLAWTAGCEVVYSIVPE